MKLIVLGSDCSITFQCIDLNIKEESSLFEWHAVPTFKDINSILNELVKKGSIDIQQKESLPGNLCMGTTNIYTSHYSIDLYAGILKRRWERFVSHINTTPVLFIYEDFGGLTTKDDIQEFKKILSRINPSADYKLLLLSNEEHYSQIQEEKLFHKKINKNYLSSYIEEACSPRQINKVCSDKNDKD